MKKAGPTECSCVIGHGQLIIKQNAQVVDLACRLYGGVRTAPFSMTLNDPKPRFQGQAIL